MFSAMFSAMYLMLCHAMQCHALDEGCGVAFNLIASPHWVPSVRPCASPESRSMRTDGTDLPCIPMWLVVGTPYKYAHAQSFAIGKSTCAPYRPEHV